MWVSAGAFFLPLQKSVPTGNDKCAFFFWFHTTFVENSRSSHYIIMYLVHYYICYLFLQTVSGA